MYKLVNTSSDAALLKSYEEFNQSCPKGHFLQSVEWAGVKNAWKWAGVISYDDAGNVRGVLGVLIRKIPVLPFTLMYAGRGPVCDLRDEAAIDDLIAGIRELAKKHRAFEMRMDPDVPCTDTEFRDLLIRKGFTLTTAGKNFDGIQPRFVFRLNVEGMSEEEVLAFFQQKTRYNIRVAIRKGVEVRICGKEMVQQFTDIMSVTGSRDGFATRPAWYFEKILDCLGEHARLYMAFFEGKPVAGTLAIHYGDKVWYLYGASANEYRNVMPNYLLQWEMIRWAVETKCRIYDFRGVSGDLSEDNPLYGLYRFKRGFNGDLVEFHGDFELRLNKAVAGMWHTAENTRKRIQHMRNKRNPVEHTENAQNQNTETKTENTHEKADS